MVSLSSAFISLHRMWTLDDLLGSMGVRIFHRGSLHFRKISSRGSILFGFFTEKLVLGSPWGGSVLNEIDLSLSRPLSLPTPLSRQNIIHMIKWTRPSPSVFIYCKWSKTGQWEGLAKLKAQFDLTCLTMMHNAKLRTLTYQGLNLRNI